MQKIKRFVLLPFILLKVFLDIVKQKKYLKQHIQPLLDAYAAKNDGSLDEEDFTKITKYYGFGVPTVLGESFATLRGEKMSADERMASTYQGVVTGIFDDFFDKKEITQERILELLRHPKQVTANNVCEELFLFFYTEFLKHGFNGELLERTIYDIYEDQIQSLDQTSTDIPFETMMKTTFNKGGNSVLFYRALLKPSVSKAEEEAIYNMGATMQMANDIFDVYKDAQANIQTLITSCTHIADVRKVYDTQMKKAFALFASLDYSPKNKTKVLSKILFVICRVFVALDQYEKLEQETGGVFKAKSYPRKALICDMEKPINLWRSTVYYLEYPVKI